MAVIDVGAAATNRSTYARLYDTIISGVNSANASGTIDTVEVFLVSGFPTSDGEVASFIDEGSNVLSTRDSEVLGAISDGSKQTFSNLDMDIESGDYIGIYGDPGDGRIEDDYTASLWDKNGDYIPASSVTFDAGTGTISLYGEGATPPVENKSANMGSKMIAEKLI